MNLQIKTGECEACDKVGVKIWMTQPGDMWLCESCRDGHNNAVKSVKEMEKEFHRVDETIVLKTDMFVAATPAFVELQAAIEHDDTIPASEKGYALARTVQTHILHLKTKLTEQRKAAEETGNQIRMFQANGQEIVAKLSAKYREQFKEFDFNYAPVVKKIKPAKTPTPAAGKSFKKSEYNDAATKYGVPVIGVRMMVVGDKKLTPETAAHKLAGQMGLLK